MDDDDNSSVCGGRSFFGHIATIIFIIAFLVIFTAYVAPEWLRVDDDKKPPGTKFQKMGLWMSCYTDLHDPYYYDPYLTGGFDGCRWIYYPVVARFTDLKEYTLPAFLIPVQVLFTLCFIILLVCLILVIIYVVRFTTEHDGLVHYLVVIGMTLNSSALMGMVAVIIFGSMSTSRTWAPDWQFNYPSWAFVCAIVGVVLEHLAGILFLIEASCQFKNRERVVRGSYNMSTFGNRSMPTNDSTMKKS